MTEQSRARMSNRELEEYWDQRARRVADAPGESLERAATVTDDTEVVALRDQLEVAHLERLWQLAPHMRVLDLAAGAGRIGLRVAPRVQHVTLVDISSAQLQVAERRAKELGIRNVSFVHGSLVDAPYEGPYDLILLLGVCVYLTDEEVARVAMRCAEALAPGGRLIMKEPVSTTGAPIVQHRSENGISYQALFRPREYYARAFGAQLTPRYQRTTCAHPFPWFVHGTDGAVEATRTSGGASVLQKLAPVYVKLDPTLLEIEEQLRAHPMLRKLLAPVDVLQDFYVFEKPTSAEVDLSVVMIAYNEQECLRGVVEELLAHVRSFAMAFELVLVDDGSKDGTLAIMEDLARGDARIRVVPLKPNRGIGGALRAGFDAATGKYVTWVPADGQIGPDVVTTLYERRDEAPMLTTIYRTRDDPFYRMLISQTLNTMIKLRTGQQAKSGGNYLFAREAWEKHAPRDDDSMMISTAFRKNLRDAGEGIVEVEIDCRARQAGHSKVLNPRAILRTLGGLTKIAK